MKIRTLIVDDEPLAREGVAALCAADAEIEIIGQCADGAAAVQTIRREHPDLLFLDVQMPKRDGFEVLEGLPGSERPVVVFVTAHDQYAIHAFEACAVDYLLKPFSDKRFQQALTRAKNEVRQSRAQDVNRRLEELLACVAELRHGAPVATAAPTPEYAERIVVKAGGTCISSRPAMSSGSRRRGTSSRCRRWNSRSWCGRRSRAWSRSWTPAAFCGFTDPFW